MAMLFPAPDGVNVILSEKSKNVNSGVALDFSPLRGIISMKRALPISGWLKFNSLLWNRNRHLAEWRFLLFTVIVMVKLPICTVKVIGMVLTSFKEM